MKKLNSIKIVDNVCVRFEKIYKYENIEVANNDFVYRWRTFDLTIYFTIVAIQFLFHIYQ